jgi:ribonucleotide reductase alpha subunit
MYIHPLYKDIINNKESIPEWFVDSSDLKAEDHLEQQSIVQKYTDGGVSKTILLSNKSDKNKLQENLSKLMLEYLHDLKGVTTYVDGSREGQPINKVTRKEVEKYLSKDKEIAKAGIESVECAAGSCEL